MYIYTYVIIHLDMCDSAVESGTPTGSGSEGGVSSSPGEEVTTCSPTCQQPQNMQTGTASGTYTHVHVLELSKCTCILLLPFNPCHFHLTCIYNMFRPSVEEITCY